MNWLILFVIIIISVFIHFLCPVHVLRQTDRHSRFCSFVCVCLFVCFARERKHTERRDTAALKWQATGLAAELLDSFAAALSSSTHSPLHTVTERERRCSGGVWVGFVV